MEPVSDQSEVRRDPPAGNVNARAVGPKFSPPFGEPKRPSAAAAAWMALPAHTVICGAILFVVGTIQFSIENIYDGMNTFVGAALAAAAVTIPALILGLPLRFLPPLRRWWFRNGTVSLVVIAVGTLVIVGSFFTGSAGSGSVRPEPHAPSVLGSFPDPLICAVGWAVLALGLAHVWFPRFLPRLVPWSFKDLVPPRVERRPDREGR
ncbi:MAG: esterase/lipase [Frondihabitans sp.]|nr:esterase/lipase [Frondihabitans sp.]